MYSNKEDKGSPRNSSYYIEQNNDGESFYGSLQAPYQQNNGERNQYERARIGSGPDFENTPNYVQDDHNYPLRSK